MPLLDLSYFCAFVRLFNYVAGKNDHVGGLHFSALALKGEVSPGDFENGMFNGDRNRRHAVAFKLTDLAATPDSGAVDRRDRHR